MQLSVKPTPHQRLKPKLCRTQPDAMLWYQGKLFPNWSCVYLCDLPAIREITGDEEQELRHQDSPCCLSFLHLLAWSRKHDFCFGVQLWFQCLREGHPDYESINIMPHLQFATLKPTLNTDLDREMHHTSSITLSSSLALVGIIDIGRCRKGKSDD